MGDNHHSACGTLTGLVEDLSAVLLTQYGSCGWRR